MSAFRKENKGVKMIQIKWLIRKTKTKFLKHCRTQRKIKKEYKE
jgi:hypothetical protein